MHLTDHDLRQLDEEKLVTIPEDSLRVLSGKLLADLKEARERINQNPSNSSRPSGSMAPWESNGSDDPVISDSIEDDSEITTKEEDTSDCDHNDDTTEPATGTDENTKKSSQKKPGNPGRQKGSQGFGRTQKLEVTETVYHWVTECAVCKNKDFPQEHQIAWTAYEVVDLEYGTPESPGFELTNTKHIYYGAVCSCGHHNRKEPPRTILPNGDWKGVHITEWRLIGASLASLIVYLAMEMRITRRRTQTFFRDLLGLEISIGTIQNTIIESAASLAPLEDQLVDDLLKEALMHADETPHPEHRESLWLWCFVSSATILFFVGYRTSEIFKILTESVYYGWLMSDGYKVYRHFKKRARCWAHLIRKARGLRDSLSPTEQRYGREILSIMEDQLMQAVYQARKGGLSSAHSSIIEENREKLDILRALCEKMSNSRLKKAKALGKEFLNDWDAIFRVLELPMLPLTNNEAEQRLRHWVLLRRISQGTRSPQGSRALALLASITTTCRLRCASPLHFIRDVIKARRSGGLAPPLPPIPDSVRERLIPQDVLNYHPPSLLEIPECEANKCGNSELPLVA